MGIEIEKADEWRKTLYHERDACREIEPAIDVMGLGLLFGSGVRKYLGDLSCHHFTERIGRKCNECGV